MASEGLPRASRAAILFVMTADKDRTEAGNPASTATVLPTANQGLGSGYAGSDGGAAVDHIVNKAQFCNNGRR